MSAPRPKRTTSGNMLDITDGNMEPMTLRRPAPPAPRPVCRATGAAAGLAAVSLFSVTVVEAVAMAMATEATRIDETIKIFMMLQWLPLEY